MLSSLRVRNKQSYLYTSTNISTSKQRVRVDRYFGPDRVRERYPMSSKAKARHVGAPPVLKLPRLHGAAHLLHFPRQVCVRGALARSARQVDLENWSDLPELILISVLIRLL